ncbi:hypothetical protein C3941_14730 [Kaistia algarum]|nr:hypothetical protein C3941_14730 [Kaistia algarum]
MGLSSFPMATLPPASLLNPPLEGGSKARSGFGAGVASAPAEACLAVGLSAVLGLLLRAGDGSIRLYPRPENAIAFSTRPPGAGQGERGVGVVRFPAVAGCRTKNNLSPPDTTCDICKRSPSEEEGEPVVPIVGGDAAVQLVKV